MNKRMKKKKDKRSYLNITDEMNIIGMTQEELKAEEIARNIFRKNYGYRKKYNSKRSLKSYYTTPSERQVNECKQFFDNAIFKKPKFNFTVVQSLEQFL